MRPSSVPGPQSQTVLIIDDTPANVGLLVDYLEDRNFRVIVAQDGMEGIKRAQFAQPDIILLDVMMPDMDGFETCRCLKTLDQTADIPVIFMTALSDSIEKINGFDIGAVDYVTKPFHTEEVLARIKTHLALRGMRKELERQNQQLQQEIAVRAQTESELRLTQYSIDHAADAVFWITPEGFISYANEAACRIVLYSREVLLTMHVYDFALDMTPETWQRRWNIIKERRSYTMETRVRSKGGIVIPLEATMSYLEFSGREYVFTYARDISERKRADQSLNDSYTELKESNRKLEEMHRQLLQAEKMASIGQLAAGVAHEINNPIAFVNANLGTLQNHIARLFQLIALYEDAEVDLADHAQLLQQIRQIRHDLDLPSLRSEIKSLMEESLDGVHRVRRIVQDLKDFSRVGDIKRQSVDLHAGLNSILNIVRNQIGKKAKVITQYGDIPAIEGVAAELNQVFMSLLINASQAIEQNGLITIRTDCNQDGVWIDVEDNGCGIAAENMTRIFEPFFTTKPVGVGTGLGLSLSYGIVTQHGGRIDVVSQVGQGSRFRVWLPYAP